MIQAPYQQFQNAETGEYTAEFEVFYQAVADLGCQNFDCNQVARAINACWTPEQAAETFNAYHAEDCGEHIDWLDRDMSMNH